MTTQAQQVRQQISLATTLCLLIFMAWYYLPHPALVVVLGILPLAITGIINAPFLMVLLFVIFSFFRIHEAFPALYSLHIPQLLALASLSVLAYHLLLSQQLKPYWSSELTYFALFFALVSVGVILASNRPIALAYYTGTYLKIGLMSLAIAWLTRCPQDFSLASKLIVLAGVTIALIALYNKSHGIGLVEGSRVTIGRDFGSMLGDPNDLALVLLFPMAFATSLIMTQGVGFIAKTMGSIAVPLLFAALLATQSRGGLLGIMTVFGFFGYRRIRSKLLCLTLGLVVALLLFALAGISDRASGGAAEAGVDESAMGRLYAWEAAFGMALHNPLTGVGLNNFLYNYFDYSPHWDGLNHAVHSTWFGVLAETGFLGLIVFLTLIIKLIYASLKALKQLESRAVPPAAAVHAAAQAVLAGLLGTVVSGTFLTQGFTWPIYILGALTIAVVHWVQTTAA